MKQADIAKIISRRTNITQNSVKDVLRALSQFFVDAFEEGEPIRLGFGMFETKMRPPKPAYDFKAKQKITLPPATYVVYRPSSRIQQVLKEKDAQLAFDFVNKKPNA